MTLYGNRVVSIIPCPCRVKGGLTFRYAFSNRQPGAFSLFEEFNKKNRLTTVISGLFGRCVRPFEAMARSDFAFPPSVETCFDLP